MKHPILNAACALLLAGSSAWAEIYETTDSEGNKVFTDSPTGAAKIVDLPEANTADGVEVPPAPPAAPAAPARSAIPAAGPQGSRSVDDDDDVYIIGNQYNERVEEEVAREHRNEVLEGEPRHEVLEGETPRENIEREALRHKEHPVATPHRAVNRR